MTNLKSFFNIFMYTTCITSSLLPAKMSDLDSILISSRDFGFDIGGRDIQMEIDNDVSTFIFLCVHNTCMVMNNILCTLYVYT
jgi:hypothetical protein